MDVFDFITVWFIASSNLTTCSHCRRKKSKLSQLCRHFSPAVQFQWKSVWSQKNGEREYP